MIYREKQYDALCYGKIDLHTMPYFAINPFSAGTVFRRQYLTSQVDPRTERVKLFIMAVDQRCFFSI